MIPSLSSIILDPERVDTYITETISALGTWYDQNEVYNTDSFTPERIFILYDDDELVPFFDIFPFY